MIAGLIVDEAAAVDDGGDGHSGDGEDHDGGGDGDDEGDGTERKAKGKGKGGKRKSAVSLRELLQSKFLALSWGET